MSGDLLAACVPLMVGLIGSGGLVVRTSRAIGGLLILAGLGVGMAVLVAGLGPDRPGAYGS